MISLEKLREEICTFDLFYQNTDSHEVWEKWNRLEKHIADKLSYISQDRRKQLINSLDEYGKRVWERYFNEEEMD